MRRPPGVRFLPRSKYDKQVNSLANEAGLLYIQVGRHRMLIFECEILWSDGALSQWKLISRARSVSVLRLRPEEVRCKWR